MIKVGGIYWRLIAGQQEEIVEAYQYFRQFLQLQSEELFSVLTSCLWQLCFGNGHAHNTSFKFHVWLTGKLYQRQEFL